MLISENFFLVTISKKKTEEKPNKTIQIKKLSVYCANPIRIALPNMAKTANSDAKNIYELPDIPCPLVDAPAIFAPNTSKNPPSMLLYGPTPRALP